MNKKEALESFLAVLDIKDDRFLKDLNAISMLVSKRKGEILFLEGDKGEDLYFVLKGAVKIFKTNSEGKEITINIAQEGELFAEIVLFLKNTYPVSAMAIENSLLLAIDSKRMFDKIKENPEFAMKFLGLFAKRLNYLTEKVKELSIDDAKERLLGYLNRRDKGDGVVEIKLPKKEISSSIGVSPETFSRILKKLSEEGAISIEGKVIKLLK